MPHAHESVINGRASVGMVLTENISDYARALFRGPVEIQAHLAHGVQNAAMDWLQAVANIRQRSTDDDTHRVVEIRPLHLLFDVYRYQVPVAVAGRYSSP